MHEDATCNDLQEIITQAINEIKQEQGENFSLSKINLAELERRTGLSRSRLRRLKENNFIVTPHGRTGQKATATILTGYSGIIDGLLQKGVTNSSVCFERLQEAGYTGGLTTVKTYIADHRVFFVKYFSLKKASEFPFFSKGFSLPSAGIMHPCA